MAKEGLPVKRCCEVFNLSRSGYYDWRRRPAKVISANELRLYRRAKGLFADSRQSLGSRRLAALLQREGFKVGRYKVRSMMKQLGLKVRQRRAYRVTTVQDSAHKPAPNWVKMQFNPQAMNQIWAADITYLRTAQGWAYLSIVMDLYSRRIIGWEVERRMNTELIEKSFMQAYHLRGRPKGVIFHSDRGAQYTSERFQKRLKKLKLKASMGDVGACWDNAVVERFFGSLKHEWTLSQSYPDQEALRKDVAAYVRYYNLTRPHTANGEMSPVAYENYTFKVSESA